MKEFNKNDIREKITQEDVYHLLEEWGGEPEYINSGLLSKTICHNTSGTGSRKLYWYSDSKLFRCFTGCEDPSFDIFDLAIKVYKIQQYKVIDLNTAIRIVASKCNIADVNNFEDFDSFHFLPDNEYLEKRLNDTDYNPQQPELKIYDSTILDHLNYSLRLPWLEEHISQEVLNHARIGYYLGKDQITIPHYDIDGNFIGLRGRFMSKEDCQMYGKYRPVTINGIMYNHPLGLNLYNLNNSKQQIEQSGLAIVFESEKSCLQYQSYFGIDNDISVACCGSNLSQHQFNLLETTGAKEIVLAFDRQFQDIQDKEYKHLTTLLTKLSHKYQQSINISCIFDKNMITSYKASPTDEGKEKFVQLFKERIHV